MLEINTDDNSETLISLSRAAQLSGYHQDYLGQLCRAGKLPASKVGRNWFTSKEAVEKLISFVDDSLYANSMAQAEQLESADSASPAQPQLVQTMTISQVDGLPVALRSVENPLLRNTNNLQEILTNMRVQSLQAEVMELREMLSRLMAEVASHARMLEARTDGLRHSYVPSSDFGLSTSQFASPRVTSETENLDDENQDDQEQTAPQWHIASAQNPQYSFSTIIAATGVLAVLIYLTIGIYTGSFLGNPNTEVSSIYHHTKSNLQFNGPTVAGDSTSIPAESSQLLPTGSSGVTQ